MKIEGSNPWAGIDGLNSSPSESTRRSGSPLSEGSVNSDEAQLSPDATLGSRLLQRLSEVPEIRQDKVDQLRASIAQGTYQVSSDQIADAMFLDDPRFSSWS